MSGAAWAPPRPALLGCGGLAGLLLVASLGATLAWRAHVRATLSDYDERVLLERRDAAATDDARARLLARGGLDHALAEVRRCLRAAATPPTRVAGVLGRSYLDGLDLYRARVTAERIEVLELTSTDQVHHAEPTAE